MGGVGLEGVEEAEGFGAGGVEEGGVVDIGVDDEGDACFFEAAPVAWIGEEAAMVGTGFCVDLNSDSGCYHGFGQLLHSADKPVFFFDSGTEMGGVVAHFVVVADEVKSSELNHLQRLIDEGVDDVAYVVVEKFIHFSAKRFEAPVDVNEASAASGDEVYGADTIVERKRLIVIVSWTVIGIEKIYLHRCVEARGIAGIKFFQAIILCKVEFDIGFRHIAGGFDRNGGVG